MSGRKTIFKNPRNESKGTLPSSGREVPHADPVTATLAFPPFLLPLPILSTFPSRPRSVHDHWCICWIVKLILNKDLNYLSASHPQPHPLTAAKVAGIFYLSAPYRVKDLSYSEGLMKKHGPEKGMRLKPQRMSAGEVLIPGEVTRLPMVFP